MLEGVFLTQWMRFIDKARATSYVLYLKNILLIICWFLEKILENIKNPHLKFPEPLCIQIACLGPIFKDI